MRLPIMSAIKQTPASYGLMGICLFTFLVSWLLWPHTNSGFELFYVESPNANILQYATHLFLHGGALHLLLNMLCLSIFGLWIEREWGATKFLVFYFLSGLGAAAFYQGVNYIEFQSAIAPALDAGLNKQALLDVFAMGKYYRSFPSTEQAIIIYSSPVVGASGAIYGLLVAFACLFPDRKMIFLLLPFPIPAKYFVPALLSLDVFLGVMGYPIFGQQIAHSAHIGGAITGLILVLVFAFFARKNNVS